MPANDTSAAIGYYPLSPTENAVYALETHLNSQEFKEIFADTGADVKIMGLRKGRALELTVAMPLLCEHIPGEAAYFHRKMQIELAMAQWAKSLTTFSDIRIYFNSLDQPGRGLAGVYLSLLGTSAEDADSGQVGRGNRVNGLISVNRPMGTEAAAGKNPLSHVGKIYNILAHTTAKAIYQEIEGIKEVYVMLLSRIGTPVDSPRMANAQVIMENYRTVDDIHKKARSIFERKLTELSEVCRDLSLGKYPIC
jgi:S-adenosylmethionine synthetase